MAELADYDLAIIGGGINGAGIARDAAGRGLRVLLVEQNDLASGTSSASTKLIHGGLRYLERKAFRLVREALAEREILLNLAPHLIRPMRFTLAPGSGPRSALMLRLGLFIYDHLGGRRVLPKTRTIDLTHHVVAQPLKRRIRYGFQYSDCSVNDSRLVVLNAVDAAERGATIRTRTRLVRAEREDVWRLILNARGKREVVTARVLVNATGPWVEPVTETILRLPVKGRVRLVKGTHIVVPHLFEHNSGYILEADDGRVVFALPFGPGFNLIGTTDVDFAGDPAGAAPSGEEISYLCRTVNAYFRQQLGADDVVWAFCGVRALYDDGSSEPQDVTRDYVLTLDERFREAPVLTVYGGKITTYRRLAEAALAQLAHFFTQRGPWTAHAPLPGGDFAFDKLEDIVAGARQTWPFLSEEHARRLVRAYGTRVDRILGSARSMEDLGVCFGHDLTAAEVRYLMNHEWAASEDDVLWRRSKLGLRLSREEQAALAGFMAGSGRASAGDLRRPA
jgi:glycerol-3-phosphate dehydrogenase